MAANFYFYFGDEATARAAVPHLEREGLVLDVRLGADDSSWLALGRANVASEEQLDRYEERFEELAEHLEGEYDGYDRD